MISFFAGFVVLFLKRKTMLGQLLKPVHGIYLSLLLIIVFFLVFSHYYSLSVLENLGTLGLPTGIGPFVCLLSGLILAVITGIVTDYYTSDAHPPVRELLQFAEYNSSLTELNGLAVGMKTLYIPIIFAVFSFLVLLVVCVLIIVACDVFMDYDFVFSWSALLFPFAVLPMFAFTLGLGFYLALLNAIIRDVGQIIGLMMTFLMLLTPVLYEQPPAESAFTIGKVLSSYNPLYYLSVGPRDLILHGKIASQEGYLVSAGIAVLLLVFGAISFHLTENRVAERI